MTPDREGTVSAVFGLLQCPLEIDSKSIIDKKVTASCIEIYSDINTDRAKSTSKSHEFLYRGQFIVYNNYQIPRYKTDVSHAAWVVEKSKKLIDLRFPEN